jgi:predicted dehydrogenase
MENAMPIRVAIVGTGKVAEQSYLPYLAQNEDVELSYYNRSPAKAEALAAQFGGWVAPSVAALMERAPDTVLVLTREAERYAATMSLLPHRPKRIFFEKPLVAAFGQAAVTEADFFEGRELLRQAHNAGTQTAMVFNYRFFEQTLRARELIAARDFGRPLHFSGLVHYACWSHCIDLILEFMGAAAVVTALANEQPGPCMGSEDVQGLTAAVRMTNQAVGSITGTCGMNWKMPLYELTFAYEHGRISMRDLDGEMEVLDYRSGRHELHALPRDVSRWDQYRASFGKSLNAYLESIRRDEAPPVPGWAGLRELQFEAAIKRSIASGAPVVLEEHFPLEEGLG